MSDILIKGIDLPKDSKISISVTSNGSAYLGIEPAYSEKKFETVVLQPHGRLIDADEIARRFNYYAAICRGRKAFALAEAWETSAEHICEAETVIEARI